MHTTLCARIMIMKDILVISKVNSRKPASAAASDTSSVASAAAAAAADAEKYGESDTAWAVRQLLIQ